MNNRLSLSFLFTLLLNTAVPLVKSAAVEPLYAFGRGARGFLVEDLNKRLIASTGAAAIRPQKMNWFETATETNLANFRKRVGIPPGPPVAGPADFAKLGLAWPSEPARCLQLIDGYEGTLFKLEGPHESGDDRPMVTYGLIGFTSPRF